MSSPLLQLVGRWLCSKQQAAAHEYLPDLFELTRPDIYRTPRTLNSMKTFIASSSQGIRSLTLKKNLYNSTRHKAQGQRLARRTKKKRVEPRRRSRRRSVASSFFLRFRRNAHDAGYWLLLEDGSVGGACLFSSSCCARLRCGCRPPRLPVSSQAAIPVDRSTLCVPPCWESERQQLLAHNPRMPQSRSLRRHRGATAHRMTTVDPHPHRQTHLDPFLID